MKRGLILKCKTLPRNIVFMLFVILIVLNKFFPFHLTLNSFCINNCHQSAIRKVESKTKDGSNTQFFSEKTFNCELDLLY